MVYVNFTLKALYLAAACFGISLIFGIVGFSIFESQMDEDLMANVLMPAWIFIFGYLLVLGERWWKVKDPEATITVWGASIKWYGFVISAVALYLFGDFIAQNGFTDEIKNSIMLTVVSSLIFAALYYLRYRKNLEKHNAAKYSGVNKST